MIDSISENGAGARAIGTAAALCGIALFASVSGVAAAPMGQDDFPTNPREAMEYYESDPEEWVNGPVEAIMLPSERDVWNDLETAAQKAQFIEWFWSRRDASSRIQGNEAREQFYELVAEANRRFRGFPRGWKSDRGRAYMILGRPSSMQRTSSAALTGVGGPDFEVWVYFTLGTNRAFQVPGGEFKIYFIEERVGSYAVYDWTFRISGSWDPNTRRAFEFTIEDSILDPTSVFEPKNSIGEYVREVTEGDLSLAIPMAYWGESGAGGAVSVPVQVALADLLFEPDGEEFVARLEASIDAGRQGPGADAGATASWEVRLQQDQLVAIGTGNVVSAVSAAAEQGTYDVTVEVSHPLAATNAEWKQSISVRADSAASMVVGKLALQLDAADASQVGIVTPAELSYSVGDTIAMGVWARGATPSPEAVAVSLVDAEGAETPFAAVNARWAGGVAGPLVIDAQLPGIAAGSYRVRVDLGDGSEVVSEPINIDG